MPILALHLLKAGESRPCRVDRPGRAPGFHFGRTLIDSPREPMVTWAHIGCELECINVLGTAE